MPRLNRKQTGTVNKKDYTGKARKISKLIMPWGRPIPKSQRSTGRVSGSSTRQSHSDPSLAPQTRGYPRNKPSQWPVEPDFVNHTLAPPLSGVNQSVSDVHNASVENAYKRAGYQ